MSDKQSANGAAPQMPLDLSAFQNEQDYLSAAKCNFILQRALKSKEDIAALGNRIMVELVEQVRLNIHLELAQIKKLQADEIAEAMKNLQDLGRSQPEMDAARAYLEGHSCSGDRPHTIIAKLVGLFEDKAKSILEKSTTPDVKPDNDKPAIPSSVPPEPTSSVASTDGKQSDAPTTVGRTSQTSHSVASLPDVSSPVSVARSATFSTVKAKSTTSRASLNMSELISLDERIRMSRQNMGVTDIPQSVVIPTAAPPESKKRPGSHEDANSKAKAKIKRPRTQAVPDKTVRIGQLDPREKPISIQGFIYVFRCPDSLLNNGGGDGINPIKAPGKLWEDATRVGSASVPGTNTQFTPEKVMALLAHKVVDSRGCNATAHQLVSARFYVNDTWDRLYFKQLADRHPVT